MKALELLLSIRAHEMRMSEAVGVAYYDEELDEAIAELEALLEPKTCNKSQ